MKVNIYDTNNKYITENQEKLNIVYKSLINKKELVEKAIKDLTNTLDKQINESKYKETISKILSGK